MALTIAPTGRHFLKDGAPFFYLADTIWNAFAGPTPEEWQGYLAYRRRQGFTALQITVLPILHDASEFAPGLSPFARDAAGRFDFGAPSPAYFEHAASLLAAARAEGLVPAPVLLWCNYVPGTWASARDPQAVMPFEALDGYVEYAVRAFAPFDPIWIISGDTDFTGPEPIRYYAAALEGVKRRSPGALTTMHLAPQADLPDEIASSADLDFYMFQSGHHVEEPARPYALAERFAGKPVTRPVVNGEPPYEGHGHGHRYGRFTAFDVRRAIWQSLLSGAGAGVTYGAHGIWSWHRTGQRFTSEAFSMRPFDWHDALHFDGAWDAGLARDLFERHNLFGVVSRQDLLSGPPEIRAAASPDAARLAVYVPYPTEITLDVDPGDYRWMAIDLAWRRSWTAPIAAREGRAVIPMYEANGDVLVVAERVGG